MEWPDAVVDTVDTVNGHKHTAAKGSMRRQIENGMIAFNGRCFNVPSDECLFEYVVWRLQCNLRGHRKMRTVGNDFCHGTLVKKEKYMDSRRSSRHSMKARK